MLQAALSRFVWPSYEEEEEESKHTTPDVVVGTPFGVTHKVHVNIDYQWSGSADPTEVFNLEDKVGEGSFGSVWRAKQRDTQFTLAVKIITMKVKGKADEEITREINILKSCNNANIVSYFGSCFNGNDLWILMDYCAVGSVEDLMVANQKTLSERQIAYVCAASIKGLDYLHAKKIIHRDIKAANILLTEAGEVKLADFGVSQTLSSALCPEDAIVGTPLFVSPEVVKDKLYSAKQDIWALGITIIEMADGYPPYIEMNPLRAMYSIPHRASPTVAEPKDWSQTFIDFLAKCLIKDHNERPVARDLLRDPWMIEFMMSGSRDVLRELITQGFVERERQKLSSSRGSLESESGSGGFMTKLSETMKTRRNIEDETPINGTTAPTTIVNGTSVIKEGLGTSMVMGTSIIRDDDIEEKSQPPEGEFMVMFGKKPAEQVDKQKKEPESPKFKTIGTQTDPVEIRPIKVIKKLTQYQSTQKGMLQKPAVNSPAKTKPPTTPNKRSSLEASPSKTPTSPTRAPAPKNTLSPPPAALGPSKTAPMRPNDRKTPPPIRLDRKTPPPIRLDRRTPPPIKMDRKTPPPTRLDRKTPPPKVERRTPPPIKIERRTPPPTRTPQKQLPHITAKLPSSPDLSKSKVILGGTSQSMRVRGNSAPSAPSVPSRTKAKTPPPDLSPKKDPIPPTKQRAITLSAPPDVAKKPTTSKGSLQIGTKVLVNNAKRGIVRYVGPIPEISASDSFVGVELSKPEGKNNGSVKGIEYFKCKDNYGVFVSIDKVTKVDK